MEQSSKTTSSMVGSDKPEKTTILDSFTVSLPSEYYTSPRASVNSKSSAELSSISSYQSSHLTGSIRSSETTTTDEPHEQTCCDYISFTPRRFLASAKFRKCPRHLSLLLVYAMFLLLGFVDRGAFLVLFYTLNAYNHFMPAHVEAIYLGVRGFVHLMYPLAGFISDTYLGRYKVILASLNVVWVGSAILAAGFVKSDPIFDPNYKDGIWSAGGVTLIVVGYTIMGVGLAGIRVNLIPFGVDQMPDASSGELSSYFQWYYWSFTVGQMLAMLSLPYIYVDSFLSYVFLLMNGIVSVFIVLLVSSAPKFEIYSVTGSPLKLIASVTKCAMSMRKSKGRFSAFHIGKARPSFMDKAMVEYGGKFTVEQVEDVKTFYRILFILVTFIGYFAIFSQINTTTIFQRFRLKRQLFTSDCNFANMEHLNPYMNLSNKQINCSMQDLPPVVGNMIADLLPLLILIPLFDRVVYVCLNGWRWFSMLGRIGIGKIFLSLSVTCALVLEIFRQHSLSEQLGRANGTIAINAIRFHTDQADSLYVASDISLYSVWPQYILFSFAELFCNITAVEFIYAQSPAAMKGLLLGLFFATAGVSMLLSSVLMLVLGSLQPMSFCSYFANTNQFYTKALDPSSQCMGNETLNSLTGGTTTSIVGNTACMDSAICAYAIFTSIALISTVMFAIAAVRYKFRKRDPNPVFPFWLYPDTPEEDNACKRVLRVLCCCVRDKDWEI